MYATKAGSIDSSRVDKHEEVAKLKEKFKTPAINKPTAISVPSEGGRDSHDRESQSSHRYDNSNNNNNHNNYNQGSHSHHSNNNYHNNSHNNQYSSSKYNHDSSSYRSNNNNNRSEPTASTSNAQWNNPTPRLLAMDENEDYGTDVLSKEERQERDLDDRQSNTTTSSGSGGGGARAAASLRLERERGMGLQKEKTAREKEDQLQDERRRKEVERRKADNDELHRKSAYMKGRKVVASLSGKNGNVVESSTFYQAENQINSTASRQVKKKKGRPLQDRYLPGTTTPATAKRKGRVDSSPAIEISSGEDDGYATDTIPTKSSKPKKKKSNSSPQKSSKISKPPPKPRSPTPPPSRTPSPEPLTLNEQIALSRKEAKMEARKEKKERQKARAIRKKASLARRKQRNLEDGDLASDSESEAASNSDGEEDSQMREETPDDLLMSEDEAPDPSTLCPFCSRSYPKNPSKQLKRLKTYLLSRPHILPKPTVRNPEGKHLPVIETASFCTRHVEENTIIPEGIEKGYPEKIDFAGLPRRISREIFSHLTDVINGDFDSKFFVDAKKEWENQKGSRKMNNILSEWGSFDIEQPGYYGTQGLEIMISTLRRLFLEDMPLLTIVRCAPLDVPAYLRRVLVPECAVELIRRDLGEFATREEAEKVCDESRDYGKAVFGTSEEEEKFGRDEDRRDEQEEKDELEKKNKKALKDKKIQGDKLRKAEELDKRKREMEAAVQPERDLLAASSGNKRVPKQKLAAIAAKEAAEDQSVQTNKKKLSSSSSSKPIQSVLAYRALPSVASSSSNGEKDWKRKMGPKNSESSDDDDDDEVIVSVPRKKPKLEEPIKRKKQIVISSSESE